MRRQISFRSILLFVTTALVSFCVLLYAQALRKALLQPLLQAGFYSPRAELCYVAKGFAPELLWERLEQTDLRRFALYKDGLGSAFDARGVYYHGDMQTPPLLSGRFFAQGEGNSGAQVAVVGRDTLAQATARAGVLYTEILGEEFEVIGVMGVDEPSRLDRMQWIPLDAAMRLTGVREVYYLDADNSETLYRLALTLAPVLGNSLLDRLQSMRQEPSELQPDAIWAALRRMDNTSKISLAVLGALLVSALFAAWHWAEGKRPFFAVGSLCGLGAGRLLGSALAVYACRAGGGVLCGVAAAGLLCALGAAGAPQLPELVGVLGAAALPGAAACGAQLAMVLRRGAPQRGDA